MPDDLSFLIPRYRPQEIDVYEPLKQRVTLNELVNRQAYQRMHQQQMLMQMQDAMDQRERAQRFRDLFSTGATPTRQQILAADPVGGMTYLKEVDAQDKEKRLAQDAENTRQRNIRQQIADIKMAAVGIPDPSERAVYFGGQIAGLVDKGVLKPEEFTQHRIPADEREAQMYYGSAYGVDKLREYLANRAKEQREAEDHIHTTTVTRPLAERTARATTERAEQILTGTAKASPAAPPALFEPWYQGWLASNRVSDNPENRSRAISQWIIANRPQFATPGVDVPKPAAVIDQEVDRAKRIAAAVGGVKPPSKELQNKLYGFKNLEDALNAYEEELKIVGPTFQTDKGAKLKSLFTNLQMGAKNLYELGAITGPDMELLQGSLTDPTGARGNWMGTSSLLQQTGVMRSFITRSKHNLRSVYQQENPEVSLENLSNDELMKRLTRGK